jgi:hypothetical protein
VKGIGRRADDSAGAGWEFPAAECGRRLAGSMAQRLMVHEEDLVVTATGCELLSRRASSTLPVV